MKPLYLEMEAIGPFIKKTKIDFSKFEGKGLFLISGSTGAGKSFIFDAICYSLYGESISYRAKELKSDYAGKGVVPRILFRFCINNKIYEVVRILEHCRKSKRKTKGSDGYTPQTETSELHEIKDNNGTVERIPLAEKSKKVNAKCEELLGLKANQFGRVILIAQGEFRELLVVGTPERERLLEHLFNSKIYGYVEDQLARIKKEEVERFTDGYKQKRTLLDHQSKKLQEIMDLVDEEILSEHLEKGIMLYDELIGKTRSKKKTRKKEFDSILKELELANEFLKRFNEKEAVDKEKEKLDALETQEIMPLKWELEKAEKATKIKQEEDKREKMRNQEKALSELIEKLKNKNKYLKLDLQKAEKLAEIQIPLLEAERDKLIAQIPNLEQLLPMRTEVKDLESEVERHSKNIKKEERKLKTAEKEKGKLELDKENDEKALKKLEDEAKKDLGTLKAELDDAKKCSNLLKEIKNCQTELKKLQKNISQQDKALAGTETKFDEMREVRERGLAGEIARSLMDGMSCPVCGSPDHPKPAKEYPGMVSKNKIIEFEKDLNKKREAFEKLKGKEGVLNGKRGQMETELEEIFTKHNAWKKAGTRKMNATPKKISKMIAEEEGRIKKIKDLKEKINETAKKIPKSQKKSDDIRKELEKFLKDKDKACLQLETKQESWNAGIDSLIDSSFIVKEPSSLKGLKSLISRLETRQRKIPGEIKELSDAMNNLSLEITKIRENLRIKKDVHSQMKKDLDNLGEKLKKMILDLQFEDMAEALDAFREEDWIGNTRRTINDFITSKAVNTQKATTLNEYLKGKAPPDIDFISERKMEASGNLELIQKTLTEQKMKRNDIQETLEKISQIDKDNKEIEKGLRVVGKLADQVRGMKFPRISLKRFFLRHRLEEVLIQASYRLKTLSQDRFFLEVTGDIRHASKKTGLDLDVHDNFTGKSRAASTLSGGQMFLASLSLALGLADVVQARSGGIAMDALFIDEGFGSLDDETLQTALQVLNDIRQGRMVGIISHVTEVKKQIPNRIEVSSTPGGSTIQLFVED